MMLVQLDFIQQVVVFLYYSVFFSFFIEFLNNNYFIVENIYDKLDVGLFIYVDYRFLNGFVFNRLFFELFFFNFFFVMNLVSFNFFNLLDSRYFMLLVQLFVNVEIEVVIWGLFNYFGGRLIFLEFGKLVSRLGYFWFLD